MGIAEVDDLAPRGMATRADARVALSLALDGREPFGYHIADAAYRAAARLLEPRWLRSLAALRGAPAGVVCLVGDGVDRLERLLQAVNAPCRNVADWDDVPAQARIVMIGCPRSPMQHDSARMGGFMRSGGLLVSSDHAASLPALRPLLALGPREAPRRARALRPGADAALLPAVYLPAGYDRLVPLPPGARGRVLATDALTDDPLVVSVPYGAGELLHAVPHWFQNEPASMTDVERRPALNEARFAAAGITRPDITVGDLQAAVTMLALLCEGLETRWRRTIN